MVVRAQVLVAGLPALRIAVRPWLALLKLRIVALLVFVSVVAAIVGAGGHLAPGSLLLLVLTGALSSAGSAALNQYFERDLDAVMARTRRRPLPSGEVAPHLALVLGLSLIAAALAPALTLSLGSAIAMLAGAFFYVFVYTLWLKRSSSWNVPIGGIAGSCAIMTGWLAMRDDAFGAAPLGMAAILFFWNQSHFWSFAIARRDEYQLAGVPMLPVVVGARAAARAILVNSMALVMASLALYLFVPMHATYLIGAIFAGLIFLRYNLRLVADPSPRVGWSNFKLSGIYLMVLFLSMALDAIGS